MQICDVQEALKKVVENDFHKRDPQVKALVEKLGPLIEADRKKKEVPGFPELNRISGKTREVLKKIEERCYQAFDCSIF
jgi:hypothetical protein